MNDPLICPHCGSRFKIAKFQPQINGEEITTKVEIINYGTCPKCQRLVGNQDVIELPEQQFR